MSLKKFSLILLQDIFSIFSYTIWLPQSQLWPIVAGAASLTWFWSRCFVIGHCHLSVVTQRSLGAMKWCSVPTSSQLPSGVWTGNLLIHLQCLNIVRTPSPYKGGVDFLKFGNKGGDEIYFLEREGLLRKGGGEIVHFYIKFS